MFIYTCILSTHQVKKTKKDYKKEESTRKKRSLVMELMIVKNEDQNSRTRRRRPRMADGEAQAAIRCVKRRRRDMPSENSYDNKLSTQQEAQADDQTSPATTVKRSSKYRGVSRCVCLVKQLLFEFHDCLTY